MSKTEFNKSVNKILQVICLTCKNTNRHKVLTSVDQSGKESMGYDEWFYWNSDFQIIRMSNVEIFHLEKNLQIQRNTMKKDIIQMK